jgi:hypothetical protein
LSQNLYVSGFRYVTTTISTNMNQPINLETITSYCEPVEPLSDWLDFNPGEDNFLDSLIEEHGDHLENFTKREKLFMLSAIANNIAFEDPGVVSDRVQGLATKCYDNMSASDLLGLMGALAEQIRWGHYAETTTEQALQPIFLNEN